MADVPSRGEETRVPGEAPSRDGEAALSSKAADSSAPPNRHESAAMLRGSDATVVAPAAIGSLPDSEQNSRGPVRDLASSSDATILGAPSVRSVEDGATIISSAARTSGAVTSAGNPLAQSATQTVAQTGARAGQAGVGFPGASAILLEIGTVLGGRYEILDLLGEGGMGAVYKAADREVDRVVALKVIRPEMASNPEILARFKQELLLSSKVTDRHVIRIYDLGEAQGIKFITMEFVDGENLHKILRQQVKLNAAEAVEIMEQVTSGLAAAHREGIIHRDLKPANIMRDKSGRVVVMDFGLAKRFSGDGMTNAGTMLGTMEYMSPEQAQGGDVQASSDIFTVGLILYELLTGSSPFYAESAIASLLMRTQQRAAPLVNVDKGISGTLSNIVSKCLEKEPAKRYQSAEHLNADLRAWQGVGGATKVSAPSTRLRADTLKRLPWLRVGAASVLVLAVGAGIAWYIAGKRNAASAINHAPITVLVGDFANHTGDSVLDDTLEPMLGVAMEGASFINVYSRGDARKLAKKLPNPTDTLDEQSSRLVAVSQGVSAVITGDISLRGDKYDISAMALDAVSGNVLAKADITVANKQEIVSDLPKLAVPIRKALGDSTPASLQFAEVSGGFTAASLEAVHQDALGVEQQFAGKFQEAFESFQKAAQLDPKFARAYTGMAAMDQNMGKTSEAVHYMNLAMANVDRMTERERYRNQGLYYLTLGDWQNCVQQYNLLVAKYPADRVGQNNLANCYTQLRNAPKALEAARHAVEIVPKGVGPRLNLAFISAFAGDFASAEKEARTSLEISPTAAQGRLVLAEALIGEGKMKDASDVYHGLEKTGPLGASTAADGLADLAAYQASYADATRILTDGVKADVTAKMPENAARKYVALANLEELQGHTAEALAFASKALADSQSTQIEFLAANVYVDAGDLARAEKAASVLAAQSSAEPQAYGKIIRGLIALKKKDVKEAVKQITAANSLTDTWIGRFDLGRAELADGSFAEANAQFDQCIKRRGEAIELFLDNVPTYAYFPPVYYYQGQAREGMKDAAFADSYKTYLSIRGQSTGDPMVTEIHRRVGQ